jgi:hypothetical protein
VSTLVRVYVGLFALLVPFTVVYGIGTYEPAGNVLFAAFLVAFAFLGVHAWRIVRRYADPVPWPEDRADGLATDPDASGPVGDFPSRSVWPLSIDGGATLLALGLAFNIWIALPGLLLLLTAVVGFALETRPTH